MLRVLIITTTMHLLKLLFGLLCLTPTASVSPTPLDTSIDFTVLLKQQHLDILEAELVERSSPTSSKYGRWLTTETINSIIQPKPYQPLVDWMEQGNIICTSQVDNLVCKGTYSNINSLFNTKLGTYIDWSMLDNEDIGDDYDEIRDHYEYIIPDHLQQHVDFIIGLTDIPKYLFNELPISPKFKPIRDNEKYISPESIAHLYNISNYNHSIMSSQAVGEFLNDNCYSDNDLQTFLNDSNKGNVSVYINKSHVTCDPIHTISPDIEATLDIQYQAGINNNTHQKYVSITDWMYQYANVLYNTEDPPRVNSMSWGWAEWDQCDPDVMPQCLLNISSQQYTSRVNTEFIKVSLKGITLVSSSGDAGAPGRTSEQCDGSRPLNPAFPASSPWVLSVGGTIIVNATALSNPQTPLCKKNVCIGGGTELNCNFERCGWTSGGGFSNYFPRPTWQVPVATHYLKTSTLLPPTKYFNSQGRIYPDISLVSHNFLINTDGTYGSVDGTSASAPSVSAMISILNNLRVSNGLSTLGPVGPLLYYISAHCKECFKDIVKGSNNSTEESECAYGYHAIEGFDAVYGLGVPNFDAIYQYIKQMSA